MLVYSHNLWYTGYNYEKGCDLMRLRRFLAAACAGVLLTGCGSADGASSAPESSAAPVQASGLNMVTLGDSISYGYGLDDPDTQRYSALLTAKLEQSDDRKWNDYNYAVGGDDSSDLLKRLHDGKALRLPSADAIVVCIGANNMLGVLEDYITEKAEEHDLDLMTVDSMTDEELAELQEEIQAEMEDSEELTKELDSRIESNLKQLVTDLDEMYDWIRERNANAEIYILNVYNPYPDAVTPLAGIETADDEPYGEYVQEKIDKCNQIISDFTAKHSDLIPVDIAAAFAKADPLPIIGTGIYDADDANTELQTDDPNYLDPHPNAEGQQLIADTIFQVMRGES